MEDFVVRLGAGAAGDLPGLAQRHSLHRLDRADGLGQAPVELAVPRDVGAQARAQSERADLELAAQALVLLSQAVDLRDHRARGPLVQAAHGRLVHLGEVFGPEFVALGRGYGRNPRYVAVDAHPEGRQEPLGERARGNPRGGLARAGALQHVAHVGEAVLVQAGKVGVPRTGQMGLLDAVAALNGPRVHAHVPVGVVAVWDEHSDRAAEGAAVPEPRADLDGIALDLHAAAPAVAQLAPGHVAVECLAVELQARGQALDHGHESGAVRLPRCGEA